jgi:photosystem II stability/assembly factor-like uncharacterized protein
MPSPTPIALPSEAHISAPSRDPVWVQVAGSRLFVSSDLGDTWQERSLPPNTAGDATFINEQEGWLLSVEGQTTQCRPRRVALWHTTDGAVTWQEQSTTGLPTEPCFARASFIDADRGYMFVSRDLEGPALYRTNDGGLTWSATMLPALFEPGATVIPGLGSVRAFGSRLLMPTLSLPGAAPSQVLGSDNAGAAWSRIADVPKVEGAFAIVIATRWLLIGPPGMSQETTDGGASWHPFETDYTQAAPVPPVITFADAEVGYATVRGSIQRTIDGGAHWELVKTPGTVQ